MLLLRLHNSKELLNFWCLRAHVVVVIITDSRNDAFYTQ